MNQKHVSFGIMAVLVGAAVFISTYYGVVTSKGSFEIHFLSVGQGDAIFIQTPTKQQILVDAGPDGQVLRELSKVMPFWDRSIDMVVATHPDMDHIGGFTEIFQRFDVGYVLDTGTASDTSVYDMYKKERDREGAEIIQAQSGGVIVFEGVYIEVLFPGSAVREIKDTNDTSVVLRIVYGEHEVLLTGDASKKVERFLVSKYGDSLQSDILKLGHHGSKTSTDPIFLETVSPEVVVVSAGQDNRYGHPHQEVIDMVEKFGAEIMGTQNGMVSFEF